MAAERFCGCLSRFQIGMPLHSSQHEDLEMAGIAQVSVRDVMTVAEVHVRVPTNGAAPALVRIGGVVTVCHHEGCRLHPVDKERSVWQHVLLFVFDDRTEDFGELLEFGGVAQPDQNLQMAGASTVRIVVIGQFT